MIAGVVAACMASESVIGFAGCVRRTAAGASRSARMEGWEIMTSERVAAVTGAASGIGRATALALSRQGARVALCDRNAAGLAEVATMIREHDGQVRVVELDVSDQGQAARAIGGIAQDWGRLDV